VYSPYEPNFGNSNFGDSTQLNTLDWGYETDASMDFRIFFTFNQRSDWSRCRWDPTDESVPYFYRMSHLNGKQICYTAEALLHAQGSYFIGLLLA
jgi:hypothetical protein